MDFTRIIADQKEERDSLPFHEYCRREKIRELEVDSPLAQVVIGLRRSGKTTLCHQALMENNVPYAYVNFDDETLANVNTTQLNDILEAAYVVYGQFNHIFLDEIQNVEGWELFVNRLLRKGLHVVLTGSNANLLSQELGTHLTGRYKEIELMPLSFREYLDFLGTPKLLVTTKQRAQCINAYNNYVICGGLPESYRVSDRRNYIKTLYNAILFKDVVKRYNVRYPKVLNSLASVLLCNFCREVSYLEIAKSLSVKGTHTLQNYANYLEKAYLVRMLPRYSFKPIRRQQSEKVYALDMGILSAFTGVLELGENAGWRLENMVFLKLLSQREQQNWDIFYWKNGCEVDFVLVRQQRVVSLVQVSYDISSEKTRQREINGLIKASSVLNCDELLLITMGESCVLRQDCKVINVRSAVEFLLDD